MAKGATTRKPAAAHAAAAGSAKRPRARKATNGTGPRPAPTLQILETRILRGPNYWSRSPVVRMLVDLGVLEQFPSNTIPGFVDGLLTYLPSLEDHACSLNRRGGFVTRLRDGTWAGHVAEHVALELQNQAGTPVRHGKTRGAGVEGQYNVVFEFGEEAVGIEAGKLAVRIVNHLVAPEDPDQALDFMAEFDLTMALAGCRSVAEIDRDTLRHCEES